MAIAKMPQPASAIFTFTFDNRNIMWSSGDREASTSGGGSLNFFVPFNSSSSAAMSCGTSSLSIARVILHRAADVNRRGEHAEISVFERADVVGADFGRVGDLLHRELFRLARGAELFGDG